MKRPAGKAYWLWFRLFTALAAAVSTLFTLIPPMAYGIYNVGVYCLGAASLLLWALVWALGRRCPRWLRRSILCLTGLGLAGLLACSIPMAVQAFFHEPDPARPCVIIVPGARVYGDRPSLMLSYRLDRAAELGALHPGSVFVVSGGKTPGDPYSEAEVMKAYLMELGVEGSRIYLEDRSTNTGENMAFSAAVIAKNALAGQIVVSTDAFHQLRCSIFAKESGLEPVYAVSGNSPWGLVPTYWVREICGLAHHYVFG